MEVHRCRFSEWMPSAICVTVFHPELPLLFAAKENGDLEIWNVTEKWFCEAKISGHENLSIRSLVWSDAVSGEDRPYYKYRLFASGLQGHIYEVNLAELSVVDQGDSYGGPIWMMSRNPLSNTVACACEDGSLRLFDISQERIVYLRSIQMCKTRIVSCGWSFDGNMIACGTINGRFYNYSFESGKSESILITKTKGDDVILWNVKYLSASQVVTGDSKGCVEIWDVKKKMMEQIFKSHEGDVLSLSVFPYYDASQKKRSTPYTLIVSAGVDAKLCVYSNMETPSKWIHTASFRSHTHDILTTAVRILRRNYTTLYATTLPKQLKKELKPAISRLDGSYDVNAKKKHREAMKRLHASGEASESHRDYGTKRAKEGPSEKSGVPMYYGANEFYEDILCIVSSGVDGMLIAYNAFNHTESCTMKIMNYPGFYNRVHYCANAFVLQQYDHAVELMRVGVSNKTILERNVSKLSYDSEKEEKQIVTERVGVASGYQSLLRINLEDGSNILRCHLFQHESSVFIGILTMRQFRLFIYNPLQQTCEPAHLPAAVRYASYSQLALFLLHAIPHILLLTTSGHARIYNIDGEEQAHGWCFRDLPAASHFPVTSLHVTAVEEKKERLFFALTSLQAGLYVGCIDIHNDTIHMHPVPHPSYPITSLTLVSSSSPDSSDSSNPPDSPSHLTRLPQLQSACPGRNTLLLALANNALFAYDLDSAGINEEFNVLNWVCGVAFLRDPCVISNLCWIPERRQLLLVQKDSLYFIDMLLEKDAPNPLPEKAVEVYRTNTTNTLNRIMNSKSFKELQSTLLGSIDIRARCIRNYSNMLCCELLADHSLLVLERPALDVIANLPKVVYRRKYGF